MGRTNGVLHTPSASLEGRTPYELVYRAATNGEDSRNRHEVPTNGEDRPASDEGLTDLFNGLNLELPNGESRVGENHNDGSTLTNEESPNVENRVCDAITADFGQVIEEESVIKVAIGKVKTLTNFVGRKMLLSLKTMRRILNFQESIMKYGVFVPRNDQEADALAEHHRWDSGRMLKWMRLQDQGTFERNWDWARVQKKFPHYRRGDFGHVFFVYDYKHSGEHRVRLVFNGSRQNPETYTDTYAPTARGESVRLFHIFAVEEKWTIAQYDVPQAFLKSKIDCDIFVYPPKNFAEFPGQVLKLKLSLYGAK